MAKPFLAGAKSYSKNFLRHVGWVFSRQEGVPHALRAIGRDFRKLFRTLGGRAEPSQREVAVFLAKKGREAYNEHRYDEAERQFRRAIHADTTYGLAHTYLGHTLYKLGRLNEALTAWGQAIEVEPGSQAAAEAQQKIARVTQKRQDLTAWIEDRLER